MTEAQPGDLPNDLSDVMACINMIKGMIGLGILTLPYGTSCTGIVPSFVLSIVIGFLCMSGILLGVKAIERMDAKEKTEADPLVKAEMAAPKFVSSSPLEDWNSGLGSYDVVVGKVLGPRSQMLFVITLLASQFFTGVAYISNITHSFETSVAAFHGDRGWILVAICLTLMVLSLIEHLRKVTYLSLTALLIYGFIFTYMVIEGRDNRREENVHLHFWMTDHPDIGQTYGPLAFAFGAFPIALVIYEEMRNKDHFIPVVVIAYIITGIAYNVFANVGYWGWGGDVKHIIYLNFPRGSVARTGSVIAVGVILTLSFVLQQMPVFLFARARFPSVHYAAVHAGVVCLATFTAFVLPDLLVIIDTVGAITGQISGFLIPGLVFLWIATRYDVGYSVAAYLVIILGCMGTTTAFVSAF